MEKRTFIAATAAAVAGTIETNVTIKDNDDGIRGKVKGPKHIRRHSSPCVEIYLGTALTYPENEFRKRFYVQRTLLLKVHSDIIYFEPSLWSTHRNGSRRDGVGKEGVRSDVKMMVCFRLLVTGR